MRFWLRRQRRKIILVLALALTSAFIWKTNRSQPTLLDYCLKYEGQLPIKTCIKTKNLLIPAEFGNIDISDDWKEVEVAYPSMRPWRSLSRAERNGAQKLKISLNGLHGGDIGLNFLDMSLGEPKIVQQQSIYGLKSYIRVWGGQEGVSDDKLLRQLILLPSEEKPRVIIDCYLGPGQKELITQFVEGDGSCTATSSTTWQLLIKTRHAGVLVPEWPIVHAKVHAFIESLVVTP